MLQPFGRSALLALSLLAGNALISSAALACKCRPVTPQEARDGAAAVIEGRVTKVADEAATEGGPPPGKLVTVSIVRTWKGLENEETVTLRTSESSASCGYTFELNTSYLIYASGTADALSVNSCSGTRPMAEASEDLALLGAGNTPVKIEPVPDAGADAGADDAGLSKPPEVRQGGCAGSKGTSGKSASLWWLGAPTLGMVLRRRRKNSGDQ